jgi:hypothetical protein
MEALSRNIYTGRANGFSLEFDNFDEDIGDNELIVYPSDCPTDSDDDTL